TSYAGTTANVVPGAAAHGARAGVRIEPRPPAGRRRAGMAAYNVAELRRRSPGCNFVVDTSDEARGLIYRHADPRRDIDEAALPTAADARFGGVERHLEESDDRDDAIPVRPRRLPRARPRGEHRLVRAGLGRPRGVPRPAGRRLDV